MFTEKTCSATTATRRVEDPEEGFVGEGEREQEGGGEVVREEVEGVVEGEGVVAPDLRETSVLLS